MTKGKVKEKEHVKEHVKAKAKAKAKGESKKRWDVYTWVGNGSVKLHESNISFKEAKKLKEKWVSKSPKHMALIALHEDASKLKGLVGGSKAKGKKK